VNMQHCSAVSRLPSRSSTCTFRPITSSVLSPVFCSGCCHIPLLLLLSSRSSSWLLCCSCLLTPFTSLGIWPLVLCCWCCCCWRLIQWLATSPSVWYYFLCFSTLFFLNLTQHMHVLVAFNAIMHKGKEPMTRYIPPLVP
jgi:hypothetical protein